MTVRIGVLGGGGISETHARAAAEIEGVRIAAVCGRDGGRVARLADEHGARAFRDVEEFLRTPLDLVLVGSPSGLHAEHAMAAARRGLHVLVEKPLDISTRRCNELIGECERAGVRLGVFYQGRAAPDLAWLRRQVEAGALGRLLLASARVKWYRPPEYYSGSHWRGTRALDGGGALMNQGIHTVDLLLWLMGPVTRVSALTRTALHDVQVEDTALALLEFSSGAVATLEATTAAFPGFARRVELTGTLGTVTVEHDSVVAVDLRTPPAEPPPASESDSNASASSAQVADVRAHRRVLEDFLRAIRTGAPPLCDGREGRRSVEVVEAVYRAALQGAPVTLAG